MSFVVRGQLINVGRVQRSLFTFAEKKVTKPVDLRFARKER